MSKKLMLIAAAIFGLNLTVAAQTPAPAAGADQKSAAEQKAEKKALGKKTAKKAGKKAEKKAEKKEAKAEEKKTDAPATK